MQPLSASYRASWLTICELARVFFPADSGATKPTNRLLHHSAYNLNDEWLYYFKTEAKGFFLDVMMTDGYEHVLRARMHEQMVRGLLAITTERV